MKILLTGAAGFVGSCVAQVLLERGNAVIGLDNVNDYYSPLLKRDRLAWLNKYRRFTFCDVNIADKEALRATCANQDISAIVHLAAQAGVRYSIINSDAYVLSNLQGHFEVLELARDRQIQSIVYASSSSVYGSNSSIPFRETDMTDRQVSFYGATKKSNEVMSQTYARLYGISLTGLRFFTVYGPWGRPDMAYWIFAQQILSGQPIRLFNHGDMARDFTFVSDIVAGVIAALDRPAYSVAGSVPHRIYNLGYGKPQSLLVLVQCLERALGMTAEKQFEDMPAGDVERTWADVTRAQEELGYTPKVSLQEGIGAFVDWYRPVWKRYLT